jgi:hypothetical protein
VHCGGFKNPKYERKLKNHPIRKKRKIRGLDIDDLLGLLGIGEFLGGVGRNKFYCFWTKCIWEFFG